MLYVAYDLILGKIKHFSESDSDFRDMDLVTDISSSALSKSGLHY